MRSEFERTWPWACAAVERYGHTHDKEDVWKLIESNDAQLHPLPNGVIITSIQKNPTGLKEGHFWLAGGDLTEILKVEPLMTEWMRSIDCERATIRGRRGWTPVLRPYGYHEVGTILVKELR